MSNLKKISTGSASVLAALLMGTAGQAAMSGNVLVNPGFEDNVMTAYGNNTGPSITGLPSGWSFAPGTRPNIVKVDGPGGQATWYTSGPDSDATASGAGVDKQYLDTLGSGRFYQSFSPKCSGEVQFGGSFSNRDRRRGSGSVSILTGAGLNGAQIGQTNTVNITAGSPVGRPWQDVNFTTSLQAGQTYSLVVTMDQNTNFDEAYVKFQTGCDDVYPPNDDDEDSGSDDGGQTGSWEDGDLNDEVVVDIAIPVDRFPPVPDGEHYQCYMLQKGDNIKAENITIQDQFGKSRVVLGRPVMLCNPSMKIHNDKTFKIQNEKRHLVCYNYIKQDRPKSQELRIHTQFGKDEVVSTRRELFCAPSGKNHIK